MADQEKFNNLIAYLKDLENAAIAFSGGVDSTFLVFAAQKALGDKVLALTINTPYVANWEIEEAQAITKELNVHHEVITLPILDAIKLNPKDRCYLCKKELFTRLKQKATEHGFSAILDGTNFDDTNDIRPGLKALKELGVKSPLLENKITKSDVRLLSKEYDLPTWDKPSYACLLTRLPFDHEVNTEELKRIESAEEFLMSIGFKDIRVRSHGDLARIEIGRSRRKDLINDIVALQIYNKFRDIGFSYVTIDIIGYRMGSFNQES